MQPTGALSKRIPDYMNTNALVVFSGYTIIDENMLLGQILPVSGYAFLRCSSLSLPNIQFQFCEGLLLGDEAALNDASGKP